MPKSRFTAASLRAARANLRVARQVWIACTDERAAKLAPIIKALRAKGITSLKGIAAALNKRAYEPRVTSAVGIRRRSRGC
jgi:hypothetical protein